MKEKWKYERKSNPKTITPSEIKKLKHKNDKSPKSYPIT